MPDSLEDLFDRAGATFAFLDLRAASTADDAPWRGRLVARPFGYGPMERAGPRRAPAR